MKTKSIIFKHFLFFIAFTAMVFFSSCAGASDVAGSANMPDAAPETYPSEPIDPQVADFSQSAIDFVAQLDAGWNLGNTLDAHSDPMTGLQTETSWNQPLTTQAMMAGLKASGITTVRIPVTWHNHVDSAFTVDTEWMNRVREVVDYAIAEDLYVIINMHHDNEEDYYFPDEAHSGRSMEFVTRIWTQIALIFRNYDEHLIFEILNEPRLVGYDNEWGWNDTGIHVEAAGQIAAMEQSALDAIRNSGSNNSQRFVLITPYVASPYASFSSYFDIPDDTAEDKIIISAHAYTPYSFAMQNPGETDFVEAHKGDIDHFMDGLNSKFVANGIPVIIGEFGATNKNNLSDRIEWFTYYCGKAASYGMSTILWDNGNYEVPASGSYSELYGYYNRNTQEWYFPELLAAMVEAYN